MGSIAERLAGVRQRIAEAALAARRPEEEIRLVAVSKRKPAALIREAYAAGQRDFGENYVQELVDKAAELRDLPELRWHMIGHLQRNKVRHVVGAIDTLHTIDSVRLTEELGRRAEAAALAGLRVLIEVNVSGESSKSGCQGDAIGALLEAIDRQPRLEAVGLMTMPPYTEDPAEARPYFDELARLRDAWGGARRLPELSMGMSHDLEQAVLAGATMVRVGTAIFGAR
jgi:pyridoxal phosphate enzyme (YggS family)